MYSADVWSSDSNILSTIIITMKTKSELNQSDSKILSTKIIKIIKKSELMSKFSVDVLLSDSNIQLKV